ncbi:MAG: ORC1-type DNA replication protein [Methanomicrobiales archaeon]
MIPPTLMADQTLFLDPEVFEADHIPEQFRHRDAQVQEIAFAIRPALRGVRPLNTVLRGLPGTGKTTSVRLVFAELEAHSSQVVPVYVNCHHDRSAYSIFGTIYRRLFGQMPPRSGVSVTRVLDAIGRSLAGDNRVLLVCLDDIHGLRSGDLLNDVLYPLLRLYEEHHGARSGVIATTSDMDLDFDRELDPAVASSFRPTEVFFPPYTAGEVREILKARITTGLYPGVVPPGRLDVVVARTMATGDLRVGLDLLKRAVLAAEREGRYEVEEEDVRKAFEVSKHVHLAATVKTLSAAERQVLAVIAAMAGGREPVASGDLYREVNRRARMSYTAFFEAVKKFDQMRLVDVRYLSGWGRTREVVLRYDVEAVERVCGG